MPWKVYTLCGFFNPSNKHITAIRIGSPQVRTLCRPQPGFAPLFVLVLLRNISDPWNLGKLQPNKDRVRPVRIFKAQKQEIISQDRQTWVVLCPRAQGSWYRSAWWYRVPCSAQLSWLLLLLWRLGLQWNLNSFSPCSLPCTPLLPCSE